MIKRKLRGGMVGGGSGSWIGAVHRMALAMDGQAEIVAGAFSSDPKKSRNFGEELYLDASRVYANYKEMAEKESALPPERKLDFVSVVTPDAYHFDAARTFLESGFNVICDKPMTCNLADARELKSVVGRTGMVFALTYTYSGCPMIKQARHMVREGLLGRVIKVVADYRQGGVIRNLEMDGSSVTVRESGKPILSCSLAIGVHAESLVRYITGLETEELSADLFSFVSGNPVDNEISVLLRYKGGAKGLMHVSQISAGEENGLSIQVYGTKQSLSWNQEKPNYLVCKTPDGYRTIYSKGFRRGGMLCDEARRASRLPFGHPEGFIEAFANIYLEAFKGIRAQLEDRPLPAVDYPTVDDGLITLSFIETVLESATSDRKWTRMLS